MILRKYMSLLGIGSAKIDLVLNKETYAPGEPVHGHFLIKGGTIDQQLKRIDCDLIAIDNNGSEKVINSKTILSSARIISEEMNQISFAFQLPDSVPASTDGLTYRFHTKLAFNEGASSRDEDAIQIIN
ncbi:sporulation protein [Peribacillus glennii]|uniref:Sporulation protein n=1 Tax=Peribacillus glennii TaxID=2303991 RepID=A0A372L670_9BACI|nr:sporulation protein [Peribacillus glennii]RFU60479.1 sporulation protein [Peribacillus glennii]